MEVLEGDTVTETTLTMLLGETQVETPTWSVSAKTAEVPVANNLTRKVDVCYAHILRRGECTVRIEVKRDVRCMIG